MGRFASQRRDVPDITATQSSPASRSRSSRRPVTTLDRASRFAAVAAHRRRARTSSASRAPPTLSAASPIAPPAARRAPRRARSPRARRCHRHNRLRAARDQRQVRGGAADHRAAVEDPLEIPSRQSDQRLLHHRAIEPQVDRDDRQAASAAALRWFLHAAAAARTTRGTVPRTVETTIGDSMRSSRTRTPATRCRRPRRAPGR